jgi:choline dehydrogenase-like flavoprotein
VYASRSGQTEEEYLQQTGEPLTAADAAPLKSSWYERPNLTTRPGCLVHRILVDDQQAVGVQVEAGGERERVYGRRATLAAGAIGSPAILYVRARRARCPMEPYL